MLSPHFGDELFGVVGVGEEPAGLDGDVVGHGADGVGGHGEGVVVFDGLAQVTRNRAEVVSGGDAFGAEEHRGAAVAATGAGSWPG